MVALIDRILNQEFSSGAGRLTELVEEELAVIVTPSKKRQWGYFKDNGWLAQLKQNIDNDAFELTKQCKSIATIKYKSIE